MKAYNMATALINEESVTELYLHNCGLSVLPEGIYRLKNLRKLEVSKNYLRAIPARLGELKNLESLVFSNNQIREVVFVQADLPNLKHIDLNLNSLEFVPDVVFALPQLESLHLAANKLKEVPPDIRRLKFLRLLDVSENLLRKIPREICNLINLRQLNISNNQISSLPKGIGNCRGLETLEAGTNRLGKLPEAISSLSNLITLKVHNNRLKTLPGGIGNCALLRRLDAHGNKLCNIPQSIGQLKWLAYLDLGKNKLTRLPDALCNCVQLKELSLAKNDIRELPRFFWQLDQLAVANLSDNSLESLPFFGNALTHLEVSNNKLKQLSFQNLKKLRYLDLAGNLLQELPQDFRTLKHLETLNAGGNFFGELPEVLIYLDQLKEAKFSLPETKKTLRKLFRFLKACKEQQIPDDERLALYRVLEGDPSLLNNLSLEELFRALNFGIDLIYYAVRSHFFLHRSLSIAEKPLQKGAGLAILGKTYFDLKELENRLETRGIHFDPVVGKQTTHILLAARPVSFAEILKSKKFVSLSERELTHYLDQAEQRYLACEKDERKLDSLRSLLLNQKQENVSLAVQMLKGGGVPKPLLTEMLIAWKFAKSLSLKKDLRALLELNVSDNAKKALQYKIGLSGKPAGGQLLSNITRLTEKNEFDSLKIMWFLQERQGRSKFLFPLYRHRNN